MYTKGRSENLLTFPSLHKNNVPKVSHKIFYILKYGQRRYVYKHTETIKYVKISIIFMKNANYTGK